MHKWTNAVNNVQPTRNSSHMAKILSVCNRLQARDYKNGNGSKRRVSRLTQFIHAMLQLNGSMKEPNKFQNYETEKITRKASDAAEYIGDRRARRINVLL